MVFWFGHQNQASFSLSVALKNRRRDVGAGHVSRYSGLLHVEANKTRISQSGLKTGGGATASGARGTTVEVASKSSQRRTSRYNEIRQILQPLIYRFRFIRT
jgi:hypothetical protein